VVRFGLGLELRLRLFLGRLARRAALVRLSLGARMTLHALALSAVAGRRLSSVMPPELAKPAPIAL